MYICGVVGQVSLILTFYLLLWKQLDTSIILFERTGMESTDQEINYDLLLTELETFFKESIAGGLKTEISSFLNFYDFFIEKSKESENNCMKNIENNSLQGYLYENANYCTTIFKYLDENIFQKPGEEILESMDNLDEQVFNMLEIIPESTAISEKINKQLSIEGKTTRLIHLKKVNVDSMVDKFKELKKSKKQTRISSSRFKYYPIRSFFFHFLIVDNFNKVHEKYVDIYKAVIELLTFIWKLDETRQKKFEEDFASDYELGGEKNYSISKDDLNQLEVMKNAVHESSEEIIDELNSNAEAFIQDFRDGKKIEVEKSFNKNYIAREYKRFVAQYSDTRIPWTRAAFILSEDWKLELEINSLKYFILKDYFNFSGLLNSKFGQPVQENLSLIQDEIEDIKSKLAVISKEKKDTFNEKVNATKVELKRSLILKLIPALREIIINADIPKAVDNFEISSINEFDKISKNRYLIKNTDYKRPISSSEFENISPHALLAYEMLPKFKTAFPDLKTGFIKHVQSFQNQVGEVPEIVSFSLESSIDFLEKENNLEEALNISTEGIERANHKLEDLTEIHLTFIKDDVEKLKESVKDFISNISEITNSENASQIKVRVAKLKAIEQSKAMKEKILLKIRNLIPVVFENLKKSFKFIQLITDLLSKKLIGEEEPDFIASDTSDYLAETEEAINKLPYIYQRLYKIEPLSTFELFVDRTKPMDEISNAYKKWKDGKFAPVIIVGEKGSGKTSFINRFIKAKAEKERIVWLDFHEKNKSPEVIYSELLKEKVISNAMDPENKNDKRSIVIIDGLERLFTSEINGFQYLLKTMQLISDTNSKLFWVVSCHIYSWYYVDKTYAVSDYFGYHIKLNELAPEDLRKIIEKRHDISGYNLVFESIPEKKNIVNFNKKVKEEEQEAESKDIYFNNLNAHNNGNISQAFLYWLRSTSEVKDETIHIRQISEMNNNFIQSISKDKMIILRSVLIHNGITSVDLSRIFRIKPELSKLRLDQLLDDGILVKTEERYFINPLIYSQIVNKFYRMNLLH